MKPTDEVAVNFDMFAPAMAKDPYPIYAHLRRNLPVAWSERHGGYWILSTYEDLRFAYDNSNVFSSYPNAIPPALGQPGRMIPLEIDPPDHGKYRRILDPYFGPRRVKGIIETASRELAIELIDAMVDEGECNFVEAFAKPFGTILFCTIAGWPLEKRGELVALAEQLPGGGASLDEEKTQELTMKVVPFFWELIESRRAEPQDDVTSVLLSAQFGGERPLTDFEILNTLFVLFIGGLETVQSVLGNAFWYLGTNPELRDQIVSTPAIIPTAVEEMLRFESPVSAGRALVEDTVVRGVKLNEGERVLLLTGSAGRDETVFPNADHVILDRQPNRHLAFAGGPHKCLGSHMARVELNVAFEEIHRRTPDYHVIDDEAVEKCVKKYNGFSRGLSVLPFAVGKV